MSPEFFQSLADLDLPEDLKAKLAALPANTLPHRDDLVKWLSLPRTFTAALYRAAAKNLGVDPPPFDRFTSLREVEPLIGAPGRFAVAQDVRLRNLAAWASGEEPYGWGLECAGLLDPKDDVESMDRLQVLLLCDPPSGIRELRAAFESADSAGNIPQCGALVQLVGGVIPVAPSLSPVFGELQARYRARSLFYTEFLQSQGFYPRPDTERELDDFVNAKNSPEWVFHLHATGGMGKTTLLRRMISRTWVIGPRRSPCAWIDLDYLEVQSLLLAPSLLALLIAAQWNEQLEAPVFSGILTTSMQPLAALLFRRPADGSASGLATSNADDLSRSQYLAGRSNPMRCGILAGALPASPENRAQLMDSAKAQRYIWDDKLPETIATLTSDRPLVLVIDTVEEASVQFSTDLRETLSSIRKLRENVQKIAAQYGKPPVEIKLILSGRYELGQRGHVPEFCSDFPNQAIVRPLPGFGEPEATSFLKARIAPRQHHLIPAMISKSEGAPFNLALFAEWAADDSNLDEKTIRQAEQITTVMLIERIVKRIACQPLRWVIRYGSVPRLLTRDFLEHVMRQPLIDALSGHSRRAGLDNPESKLEIDVWAKEKNFQFDSQTLWDEQVMRYAGAKGWLEPAGEAVRFRSDVQNPMRVLLRRQPVFAELHRAAVNWFDALAGAQSGKGRQSQRLGARIEWFYHVLQLRTLDGDKPKDLMIALQALFDVTSVAASATLRRETANTLLTPDFVGWQTRERAYIEYRLAEAIAAENSYKYLSVPDARRAILKVFETAGPEDKSVLPPFAYCWKLAADGTPVSMLTVEMKELSADDAGQLAMLIAEMAGPQSKDAAEALQQALYNPGRIVPAGWLSERLARHFREPSPTTAIAHYKEAARDFEARGDLAKRSELLAAAAKLEISLGRLSRARRILEPLEVPGAQTTPVTLQLARVELLKGQPGMALEILHRLSSQLLDDAARLELSTLRADALSQRVLWSEAQEEWERALLAASSQSKQQTSALCIAGLVRLQAWWLRRTDRTALTTLSERASSLSADLPPAELEVWRISLGGEESVRRQALARLRERAPVQRIRLLLALSRFGLPEARWLDLLEAADQVPPGGRIGALMEPALLGDPPTDLRLPLKQRIADALRYDPEDEIEGAWYAIRHGELLAWLGFHQRAADLLAEHVPVIHPEKSLKTWQAAVYRERRRVEQRIRDWGGRVDPAPDPTELWTSLWSHTPFRLAAVLVENAQRANDAGNRDLVEECLSLAEPVLQQTHFDTAFHQTQTRLRQPLGGSAGIHPSPGAASHSSGTVSQETEILSLRSDPDLIARWQGNDRRIYSDSEVQELLARARGIPKRLVKLRFGELVEGLQEIVGQALGRPPSDPPRIGLQLPFGPLSAVPWEMAFTGPAQPFRVPSGAGDFRLEPPSPSNDRRRSLMIFPLSSQAKESLAIPAYFDLANRLKAESSLDALSISNEPVSVLYIAGSFEELTTLNEPVIAGLQATASTLTQFLERFAWNGRPAVVLDVPAMRTQSDQIHQMLMRNYFAQALLDGGIVSCVLATGLRDFDSMREVHQHLIGQLEAPTLLQADLLDQISHVRSEASRGDALFTRNPWNLLAGTSRPYA